MTSDLLFSVLPREGKVPIAHDNQKVEKIDKLETLRVLSDKDKELKGEENDTRKKQQQRNKNKQSRNESNDPEQVDAENFDAKQKNYKGPKHLDIYV